MLIAEEASFYIFSPNLLPQTLRPAFSVAEFAGGRHLHASPPWVECMCRPFDLGILGQASLSYPIFASRFDGLAFWVVLTASKLPESDCPYQIGCGAPQVESLGISAPSSLVP